jgi:thiol-disulfide isomerase/thioredoxin
MLRPWWQTPWAIGGGGLVVLVAVIVIVVIVVNQGAGAVVGIDDAVPGAVLSAVTDPSASVVSAVAGGGSQVTSNSNAAGNIVRVSSSHTTLTSNGKPEIVYFGGEYCPYCAAERWAIVMALSRFGSFSGLQQMASSPTDVFPNTHTFTFLNASYTSSYLVFNSTEAWDRNDNPLQSPTTQVQQILQTYQQPPYQASSGIPFLDIANRYTLYGVQYSPGVLAGLTWQQIAGDLSNPQSPVTQAIVGSANYLTAAICLTTGNKPASVCSSPTIQSLAAKLSSQAAQ